MASLLVISITLGCFQESTWEPIELLRSKPDFLSPLFKRNSTSSQLDVRWVALFFHQLWEEAWQKRTMYRQQLQVARVSNPSQAKASQLAVIQSKFLCVKTAKNLRPKDRDSELPLLRLLSQILHLLIMLLLQSDQLALQKAPALAQLSLQSLRRKNARKQRTTKS